MPDHPFSIFISSKMAELLEERRAVQEALADYHMTGWRWESDSGARPTTVRQTYLREVEDCDLYLGLFWLGYGPYTIEEYEHARKQGKPCLLYEKRVELEHRDPLLQVFLDRVQQVGAGVTVCYFTTIDELAGRVKADVQRVLVERYRKPQEARSQEMPPQVSPAPGTVTITVGQGGVGAYSIGSVTTNTTINNQH